MSILREPVYISEDGFLTLTFKFTTNVGNGPHVVADTGYTSCLQGHATVQSEGCSWWYLRWLPSVQVGCDDCLCKLGLSLLPTGGVKLGDRGGRMSFETILSPNTSRSASWEHELCVQHHSVGCSHGQFHPHSTVHWTDEKSVNNNVPSW